MASASEAGLLLRNELEDLRKNQIDGFSACEMNDDIFQWKACFHGFKDTRFEGRLFLAFMSFPQNYPHSPPTVWFPSGISHPHVRRNGEVSGSFFLRAAKGRKLAGAYTVKNTVRIVQLILSSLGDESPAKVEAVRSAASRILTTRLGTVPPDSFSGKQSKRKVSGNATLEVKHGGCGPLVSTDGVVKEDSRNVHRRHSTSQSQSRSRPCHSSTTSSTKVISLPSNKDGRCFEHESSGKQFRCDGCKQQGSGPRYRCLYSNYEFHEQCASPKPTATHDFIGDLELRFFDKPPKKSCGRRCDACGKDVLGFNYQSSDGQRVLHPCCSKLPKKLPIKETQLPTKETHFELREKIPSNCIWCPEEKISGGSVSGWGYASSCGDYHFHVHCLMEMLLHTDALIKDGSLGSERIVVQRVAQKSKENGKGGWRIFSTIVKIFLETVLSVLLGYPIGLLATVVA